MWVNLISFYIAWWSVLYFAKIESNLLLILISIIYFFIHYFVYLKKLDSIKKELRFILSVAMLGIIGDLFFHWQHIFILKKNYFLWLFLIWPIFTSTLNYSLKKIWNFHWSILSIMGLVGGPISYIGASKFELIDYTLNYKTLILHGLFWVLLLLLIKYFRRIDEEN